MMEKKFGQRPAKKQRKTAMAEASMLHTDQFGAGHEGHQISR